VVVENSCRNLDPIPHKGRPGSQFPSVTVAEILKRLVVHRKQNVDSPENHRRLPASHRATLPQAFASATLELTISKRRRACLLDLSPIRGASHRPKNKTSTTVNL